MKPSSADASARCDIIMGRFIALTDRLLAEREPNYMNKEELGELLGIQRQIEGMLGLPNADRLRGVD
jgi:hypothetical protein